VEGIAEGGGALSDKTGNMAVNQEIVEKERRIFPVTCMGTGGKTNQAREHRDAEKWLVNVWIEGVS